MVEDDSRKIARKLQEVKEQIKQLKQEKDDLYAEHIDFLYKLECQSEGYRFAGKVRRKRDYDNMVETAHLGRSYMSPPYGNHNLVFEGEYIGIPVQRIYAGEQQQMETIELDEKGKKKMQEYRRKSRIIEKRLSELESTEKAIERRLRKK